MAYEEILIGKNSSKFLEALERAVEKAKKKEWNDTIVKGQILIDNFSQAEPKSDYILIPINAGALTEMIDEIKQAQTNQIRHYRMAVVAAFVAGIIFGSVIFAIILTTPSDVPLFSFGINFYPLMLIEQNSRLISMLLTSLIIAFCIVAMMNINEMVNRIRPQHKP